MRLRSSQFVFLLLLVCSVQIRADYASQLLAEAGYGGAMAVSAAQDSGSPASGLAARPAPERTKIAATVALDDAARSAHRVVWSVRQPALDSAAVVSFTGFRRS